MKSPLKQTSLFPSIDSQNYPNLFNQSQQSFFSPNYNPDLNIFSSGSGISLSGGSGVFGGNATNLIGSSGDAFNQTIKAGGGAAGSGGFGSNFASNISSPQAMAGIAQGVGGIIQGLVGRRRRRAEQAAAQGEYNKMLRQYQELDTSNLYADVENQYSNLENTFEDLTVNQQQAQFEKEMFQQQQANIMQGMSGAAGGSGIAALAQAMANQGQIAAQKAGASIGMQESKINMLRAQEASKLQMAERGGAARADAMRLAGAEKARSLDWQKTSTELGMAQQDLAVKNQAIADADAALYGGVGQLVGVGAQLAMSDRKMKKNINLVGKSPNGLNIYNFEYINSKYGEGIFQGVMADEVPYSAIVHGNNYKMVDYSMVDVEFKRIN